MAFLSALGLNKLKESLARTREGLTGKIARLVTSRSTIDDDVLEQVEEILLGADVGIETSSRIIESIRTRVKQERYADASELQRLLRDEVRNHFPNGGHEENADPFAVPRTSPYVILVVGINGVGKTTTIGKLAHEYRKAGKRVMIAAADTFRAAANEQLAIWAHRAGAELVQQKQGADPAAVAYDAIRAAAARSIDVVIVDTAGRIHTRVNLMEELKKVRRVIEKGIPSAPHEVFLVIDATTGQNGLRQAKEFGTAVGVTGVILTKLDGTAKGGVVLAIAQELKLPVKFIGVGEQIDDLQPFDSTAFVEALFA